MAISISDFKTWAGANQRTAVAVNNGALESASNQIGLVDRLFRRGTVDSVRSAAMKDFTRALSARYGVTIAQQAIANAGLSANSELTGRTISSVVANAKKLRADMLRPIGKQDLVLGDTTIAKSQFKGLGPDDKAFLVKFLKRRAVAAELLGEFPLSMPDYQDFHARATDLVVRLRAMRESIVPANVPADEFYAEVDALVRAVEGKLVQMRDLLASPRRSGRWRRCARRPGATPPPRPRSGGRSSSSAIRRCGRSSSRTRSSPSRPSRTSLPSSSAWSRRG